MRRSLVIAMAFVAACGGAASVNRPSAVLSTSMAAATTFDDIRDQWSRERAPRSPELRDKLIAFLAQYPNDALAATVHTYLAVVLMEQGEDPRADAELAKADRAPVGSARDFVNVVHARSLRLKGQPGYALELLRPLVGKIIDPTEREIFLEELSMSAIDAKLPYEALAYMDAWLRGVTDDQRDRVRTKVKAAVATLPRDVVETTYRSMRRRTSGASSYGTDLEKIVAIRLGEIAVTENDAQLARWLLDPESGGAAYPTEDLPQELGDLATSRRGLKTVYGRMIGLLLSSATDEARDRSAEVARGVAFALGLPRASGAAPLDVRLITRSDGGDFPHAELALEELTGEGVSVVIAGVDGPSADRAQRYCQAHQVPLVLLHPGSEDPTGDTLLYGMGRGADLPALAAALTQEGLARVALVTNAEGERGLEVSAIETQGMVSLAQTSGCDALPAQAGEPRFPVFQWQREGLRGIIVSGSGECARDVVIESRVLYDKEPTFALTLDAAETSEIVQRVTQKTRVRVISPQAGLFPVLTEDVASLGDADLARYVQSYGARPTWWVSLGRDAGVLAKRAVTPLPEDGVTDNREVAQRRAIVEAGLVATRAKLWTTDAPGFTMQSHVVPRMLKVIEWPKKY